MATIEKYTKKDGKRGYRVNVRVVGPSGRTVRKTKRFGRLDDARDWARETESAIKSGRDRPTGSIAWADLIEAYLDHPEGGQALKGEPARRRRRVQLEWWRERLGRHTVDTLKPVHVDRCKVELRRRGPAGKPCSPATINRYLSALGAVHRWAERLYGLHRASHPTTGMFLREPDAEPRWLTPEEVEILLEEVAAEGHADLELLVRLGITTGRRQMQLVRLTWSQVDFGAHLIRFGTGVAKNGKPDVAPLAESVEATLQERRKVRRISDDYVFTPNRGASAPCFPRKRWEAVRTRCKERGVPHFIFHELRDTVVTSLLEGGWDLRRVQHWIGHLDYQSTLRYAGIEKESLALQGRDLLARRGLK